MSDTERESPVHRLIGGGIASLPAAVFLMRGADTPGRQIRVYEQLARIDGSLDGSGDASEGLLVCGGRTFESHFACTLDLLSSIPTLDDPDTSLADDIGAPCSRFSRGTVQWKCVDHRRL